MAESALTEVTHGLTQRFIPRRCSVQYSRYFVIQRIQPSTMIRLYLVLAVLLTTLQSSYGVWWSGCVSSDNTTAIEDDPTSQDTTTTASAWGVQRKQKDLTASIIRDAMNQSHASPQNADINHQLLTLHEQQITAAYQKASPSVVWVQAATILGTS